MPIFDQGYQHWSGQLSGHAWRWLAVTRHGLRVATSGWAIRLVLFAAAMPALMLAFALCLWGLLERNSAAITAFLPFLGFLDPEILAGPRPYREVIWTLSYSIFLAVEIYFAMTLILLAGPNLISQDLRYNAFPLYFSRPLRRIDYFLGKLGVIVALLSIVLVVPSIIAYVLGLLFSLDVTIVRDTFGILLAAVAFGLIMSVSAGMLILALSSLSRNSRYVALMWVGMWIVSGAISGILQLAHDEDQDHRAHQAARDESAEPPTDARAVSEHNWRPLVSYQANLDRIRQALLSSDAAWDRLAKLNPSKRREEMFENVRGPRYPWYWSAAVLVGLFGLSACTLNFTIKSLDRLK